MEKKHTILAPYIRLLGACTIITLMGCLKKEASKPAHFLKQLEGRWHLSKDYQINSETRSFTDYDINHTFLLFSSIDDAIITLDDDWQNGGEYVRFLNSDISKCMINIENEHGLFLRQSNKSDFFSDFVKILGVGVYECESHENIGSSLDSKYLIKNCGVNFVCYTKSTFNVFVDEENDHYKNHLQIDDISYFKTYGFSPNEKSFSIKKVSANEIELTIAVNVYNRYLQGEWIPDILVLNLQRSNSSSVVTIPPFHPNNYALYWWNNCNGATGGITLKGNASIQPNGIDNYCVCTDGFGSYAEYTQKPQVPMTLSFWVKPATVSRPKQVLYSKYKNKFGPFILSLEQDKFVLEINDGFGNLQKITSAKSVSENEWNHICISVDADNKAVLYINGDADGQGTINSLTYDASAKILLGTTEEAVDKSMDINLRGCLDEIIFFKKVLSAGEIKQLYLWHLTN